MLRGGKNVCEESFPRSRRGALELDSGKNHIGGGGWLARPRRNAGGQGEWVGEKKQARSCLGVTDLGIAPYWNTAISTLLACTNIAHGTKERCDHEGFCRPLAQQRFEYIITWRIVRQ